MEIVTQKDEDYKNTAHDSRVNHQLGFFKTVKLSIWKCHREFN